MMKVKFFEGILNLPSYSHILTVEQQVQEFINEHPDIEIKHIKQSSIPAGIEGCRNVITISIWYTEN